MILPSVSEGISRAILEALYLGTPCILRDIDAEKETIQQGTSGSLFQQESDLKKVAKGKRKLCHTTTKTRRRKFVA